MFRPVFTTKMHNTIKHLGLNMFSTVLQRV